MISDMVSIGHDICLIDRFEPLLHREAFLKTIFGEQELSQADRRNHHQCRYLAGSWVAKESLSKAFGLGLFDWHLPDAQWIHLEQQGYRSWIFTEKCVIPKSGYVVKTSVSYESNVASAVTIVFKI
ncbi:4'-phosphopantetheinyl transferase superfamily protein [Entomospira entomophila]|uniref:4'-phosphopantetheinyl transferase superfamily protein n=1 Tax=Entomospira entomophila TaxID=2719988 RepID=A0A968KQP6_9SPIO|nr:4'-phosphopantetheinyl transferase superfamily protein [Entomospira entomophilus]NIZ39913.1 4'-phosphopantetheinyl transferase superfamily protein [Entomospira entomophilus]WDI35475.1 4'-phosphopantetheinyl transferase superfamily protein [Entomospira entomophilus]